MVQHLPLTTICITMDAVPPGLESSTNYIGEASAKPLIYAVKIKLESAVYSQLAGITRARDEDLSSLSHNGRSVNTPPSISARASPTPLRNRLFLIP
jgi:hypothetical protein